MLKRLLLTLLSAALLTGCWNSTATTPTKSDLKSLSRSMPAEEQSAYRFVGLLLQGDYQGIYQLMLEIDPTLKVSEEYVVGMLGLNFGYLPAGVSQCGGLESFSLAKKVTVAPGKEYHLTYKFSMKDKSNPKCAERNLPPIKAKLKGKLWDLILPMG